MVQYIHTPWRDRAELLRVRRQFYPSAPPAAADGYDDDDESEDHRQSTQSHKRKKQQQQREEREAQQQHAVSRVAMWMQRGSCPHLVESTALLTAAALGDANEGRAPRRAGSSLSSSYAVRAAYAAAFSRFVTGLLDSQQDKQRKMSMYAVAKTIGLPATFVELRHQATHEQLPSLLKLRAAAQKALAWIWDFYWAGLTAAAAAVAEEGGGHVDVAVGGDVGGENGNAGPRRKRGMRRTAAGASGGREEEKTKGAGGHDDDDDDDEASGDPCRLALLGCLRAGDWDEGVDGGKQRTRLLSGLARWDEARLLQTLGEVGDDEGDADPALFRRSLQLSRVIVEGGLGAAAAPAAEAEAETTAGGHGDDGGGDDDLDLEALRADLRRAREDVDGNDEGNEEEDEEQDEDEDEDDDDTGDSDDFGWARYEGAWRPKPIGVV